MLVNNALQTLVKIGKGYFIIEIIKYECISYNDRSPMPSLDCAARENIFFQLKKIFFINKIYAYHTKHLGNFTQVHKLCYNLSECLK